MNLLSEMGTVGTADALNVFPMTDKSVTPFEFRMLTSEDSGDMFGRAGSAESHVMAEFLKADGAMGKPRGERAGHTAYDAAGRETTLREAAETARQDGFQEGEREGRRAARAELATEVQAAVARERCRVTTTVEQFRGAKDRYFADVEQEVVKLALAIAARVLHRESQLDPLLLAGVVRVALEKMADRTDVVLRVASPDVDAWQGALLAMQPHERPRVADDARLERGECVLETTMGTVELGVKVQLEEIEKGFFDLLNHRPTD
jgi:flagellar assembly protein FliH